jgi:pimeloyl-ACP methyl ester carboxylesterase
VPRHSGLRDQQSTATADVFFVHLTTLIRPKAWTADVHDAELNRFTEQFSIRKQASVFNAAGRIYAPRYRQAALYAFFDSTANGKQALELAYTDVRAAFEYYLKHHNQGRPIILAGHSQGTYHAQRLLREFFDRDPELRKRLVAAYLVGLKVDPSDYEVLRPCQDSLQTGCYVSWNTAEWGNDYPPYAGAVVVNPLSWTADTATVPAKLNRGSVPYSFDRIDAHIADAKVRDGVLWVHAPKPAGYLRFYLPGRAELRHSFHIMDYGLYYLSVRRNAVARVQAWQRRSM